MSDAALDTIAQAFGLSPDRARGLVALVSSVAAPDPIAERAWYTVDDVARLTGWSKRTVQDKAKAGEVPMFKIGADWRITPAAFDVWENRMQTERTARAARHRLREHTRSRQT